MEQPLYQNTPGWRDDIDRKAISSGDDDDDDDDDDDGVYRQLVSLKLTTSSSNLQLHR